MLKRLKQLVEKPETAESAENRRVAARYDMVGMRIVLLVDARQYTVHLKDLSSTGMCGLTDAPLTPGQRVCFMFDQEPVPAEICWIRRALIGARFPGHLTEEQLKRLRNARSRTAEAATQPPD